MTIDRRKLARELSRVARASIEDILSPQPALTHHAQRIGFTGPPGAGKSTLIANWAEQRLQQRRIGVLSVDPSSPVSQGSILGDRIRMEHMDNHPHFYMRSVPSTRVHDGLCHNIVGLLEVFDRFNFDDTVLETVGVGQAEHNIRYLVDTVVLVLLPNSGDVIQAMKAGIMEMADIYVVNKCDLPGAEKMTMELRNIMGLRRGLASSAWQPKIINVSATTQQGLTELNNAINEHSAWCTANIPRENTLRARTRYQLMDLVAQRAETCLRALNINAGETNLAELFAQLTSCLHPGSRHE